MRHSFVACLLMLCVPTLSANESLPLLSEDCYREWQSRGWLIGEDNTPADQVPRFANGIKQLCEIRAGMYAENPEISPYIEGRIAELAPYIFGGDETAMKSLIMKLQQRRPGPDYSGAFMRD